MDSNGLTDLRELHRDHVVFQELFWTESFEWRDEMDNFCGISRICNYLTYNFNGKMSHRRHIKLKLAGRNPIHPARGQMCTNGLCGGLLKLF